LEFVSRTMQGSQKRVNEDRLLTRTVKPGGNVMLIADGLGGHPGGEVASGLVVDSVAEEQSFCSHKALRDTLRSASEKIMQYGASHPTIDGMGSTATLVFIQNLHVHWAHVGDGRLYHFQNDQLHCVTRDQTLARQLYDLGEISWEDIRHHKLNHFLEQCLGEEDIVVESGSFICKPDDILLLNTDGLHDMVPDSTIKHILAKSSSLSQKADRLLQEALESGGMDDIALILCCVG